MTGHTEQHEAGELAEAIQIGREREVQMIGAAISLRDWHGVETAYNQLRDRIDRALIAHRLRTPPTPAPDTEAVAVIGKDWSLLWASPDTLTGIVARTGITIGSKLYAHPPTPNTEPAGGSRDAFDAGWRAALTFWCLLPEEVEEQSTNGGLDLAWSAYSAKTGEPAGGWQQEQLEATIADAIARIPRDAFWQVGHDGEGSDPSQFKARLFDPMTMARPAEGWGETPADAILAALTQPSGERP